MRSGVAGWGRRVGSPGGVVVTALILLSTTSANNASAQGPEITYQANGARETENGVDKWYIEVQNGQLKNLNNYVGWNYKITIYVEKKTGNNQYAAPSTKDVSGTVAANPNTVDFSYKC